MKFISTVALAGSFLCSLASAQFPVEPNVEVVEYSDPYDNEFPLQGFVSIPEGEGPFPAVVIIPDWNNVDVYEHVRATLINEQFGWVGFAADVYGPDFQDGIPDFGIRREQATLYRSNNTLFMGRMQAAVDLMAAHPSVDPEKIGIIGYCFGGTGILTFSFLGGTGVKGAVSFHGGLAEFPVTDAIPHPVLVLSGGDDDAGTDVEFLESQLNEANATWQITRYSGIEHAFTVWTDDRYNELADSRSWREMETFFKEAFGEITYGTPEPNMTEVVAVDYDDDGFALTGYLAIPEGASMDEKLPAVVIVPDWDGVSGTDGYEAHRATLLASEGYIAFAADIYGSDLTQVDDFGLRVNLTGTYRTDYELFVSRIQAAVDVVAAHELVDPDNILMIGYCFGGTGVVDYAFAGLQNVKAVVPFHGGLTSLAPIQTDAIYPYVLVQSGGEDDAHGNNTELEMALDSAAATWEITRYSNVFHGFTDWEGQAYNALADWRSWDAMHSVFERIIKEEPAAMPTITDLAVATEDLSTLVDLVVLAELAETLAGPGPFTVFAPLNSAFAALDNATVSALVADPAGALTDVLLYHVVSGTIMSTDLVDGAVVPTIGGENIVVSLDPVMINDANVVAADIMAANGVVHVIDKVLVPGASEDEEEDMEDVVVEESEDEETAVSRGSEDDPEMDGIL